MTQQETITLREIGTEKLPHLQTMALLYGIQLLADQDFIEMMDAAKRAGLNRDVITTYITNNAKRQGVPACAKIAEEQENRKYPRPIVERLLAYEIPADAKHKLNEYLRDLKTKTTSLGNGTAE